MSDLEDMARDFDEIVSGGGTEIAEESTAEVEPEAEEEGQPTGEKDSAGEEPEEEAASPAAEEPKVEDSLAQLKAEIAGRDAELARIRKQNRDLKEQSSRPAEPEKKVDFFDDPDAALAEVADRIEQRLIARDLNRSELQAKARHADFDAKADVFVNMAEANPTLWAEMRNQPDPAEWAYQQATSKLELDEVGNVAEFKARVQAEAKAKAEAEVRAQVEKEMRDKYEAEIKKRAGLPTSLSNARGVKGSLAESEDEAPEAAFDRI